jgi:monosaccharide ABC transporter substrate-binding protein, CUT2 family (TC 3.A.1.2.-)
LGHHEQPHRQLGRRPDGGGAARQSGHHRHLRAYDEFAKGAKTAVDEAGLSEKIKIYSADISTPDISAMVEDKSAWAATAATSSAVVGEVCVRTLALQLAGVETGAGGGAADADHPADAP